MKCLKYGFLFLIFFPLLVQAAEPQTQHSDPIVSVILWVTLVFLFAIIGRFIAKLCNQPGVLGELLMGVFLGNLCYFFHFPLIIILREGSAIFTILQQLLNNASLAQAVNSSLPDPHYAQQVIAALSHPGGIELIKVAYILDIFSRYGVLFLLFMVGLESSVEELRNTGRESLQVAVIGVLAPILFGFITAYLLLPNSSYKEALFIAATLSATSIGITARVLKELKKLRTREARIILGAATIDDVLGLVILAIVSSMVINDAVDIVVISRIIVLSLAFFGATLLIAPRILPPTIKLVNFLEPWEVKLVISFVFVMVLAWLAALAQLSPIIGAFTAGIILRDEFFVGKTPASTTPSIKALVSPLESLLAPLFFMLIGIQVKLESFLDWQVLMLATGLIVAAILGKLLSGLGASSKDDRLLIGLGMLPRGEVGLVFASVGKTLGVMSDQLFSAIILMVIVTTLLAPPCLKMRYLRAKRVK